MREQVVVARPGLLALIGSGEIAAAGQRVHEWLFKRLSPPIRVAILETPAGFELNSAYVAGRLADFIQSHLQNYHPQISVIPARRRGTPEGPDNPHLLTPLLKANYIFMGPGSPTYAVRHLAGTPAWHTLVARHRLGATISFASAAAIAVGAFALPVYEIYKAGEDPHWRPGLDLLSPYGLRLVVISHWNNQEGGANLDTSRCFMGKVRMDYLLSILPRDTMVMGIDEHTGLIVDLAAGSCFVQGDGGVTLVRAGREEVYAAGSTFPVSVLGSLRWPAPQEAIPPEVWQEVLSSQAEKEETLPEEIASLIQEREAARRSRDWATADGLREQLAALGYRVLDTPEGPRWERIRGGTLNSRPQRQ